MKIASTFVPSLALLSLVLANKPISSLVDTYTHAVSTQAAPAPLDESYVIDVDFINLSFFTPSTSTSPKDTFLLLLNTTASSIEKKNQILNINVDGIRTVIPNVPLSLRACDYTGTKCSSQTFDHDAFASSNTGSLKVADFGTEGNFFFLYLQVPQTPGQDNSNYHYDDQVHWIPSTESQYGPSFSKIVNNFYSKSPVAFTLALSGNK